MTISSKYEPGQIEEKWYKSWLEHGLFRSTPDEREAYTIVIPPPNVTGVLHMGHMLNNTIQDVLIRRARLLGKNACWVPGTDHASIATEAKVVAWLKEQGLDKKTIGRDAFLKYAFEWKDKYGGIILNQLQKLGCSCDWDRTRFTMEPALSEAVIKVFVDMYNEGLIYKGARMVNWDPTGMTALSDEEVIYKESDTSLYYVKYQISDGDDYISIATTRPETIMGDTAICVHPDDKRYQHLLGKHCVVPLVNRTIPIIADTYVEMDFGTGALKVTPAHDLNDYQLGQKHQLDTIDVLNDNGTMSAASVFYEGMDRFAARKRVVLELEESGHLIKQEIIKNKIGLSERTQAVIEPRISAQWFVDMKKFMEKNPEVLDSVMNEEVQLHPAKYKNTYRHWIENIKDWCISRQLWWGHRIPAWYLPDGSFVVAETSETALMLARKKNPSINLENLTQDEDVLDTWFSSWLWPISVFDGFKPEGRRELDYYYPTNDVVTGPDIIFFWIARMVMAGYQFEGKKPFSNVYFTGIVRDKQRRKMSKSLGNSPEPLDLMSQYGTDGVRLGLLLSAPAGNDLLFDEALCEQGRNFCNKIWNAYRLLEGLQTTTDSAPYYEEYGDKIQLWMETRMAEVQQQIDQYFTQYRISDALMQLYKLIWDDFCSWYLEMIKPPYGDPIPEKILIKAKKVMSDLMVMLHPFTPFITEELWQNLHNHQDIGFINQQSWPDKAPTSFESAYFQPAMQLVSQVRAFRNEKNISPKIPATIYIQTGDSQKYIDYKGVIQKLSGSTDIHFDTKAAGFVALLGTDEVTVTFEGVSLTEKQDPALLEAEIQRLEQFLLSVQKKLENEKFVQNAQADVVERERQKLHDTELKIQSLKAELAQTL